ncbi:hypothetical protein BT69DRAFT_495904 [Atractiella rhizophila]|nr:hypothetical protein BT69DRAFT_495904 [Atractiella rhizophila]
MSFSRRLLLPPSDTSNAPPPQITEVVLTHPFRGSAFEFPPSREWKEVHLALELPRIGGRQKNGSLEGELWTVKGGRLFEIGCYVGVELGGGMFDKKLAVEVPITVLHPLAVPPEGHKFDPNLTSPDLQQGYNHGPVGYNQNSFGSVSYHSQSPGATDFSPGGQQYFQIPQQSVNYGSLGPSPSPAPWDAARGYASSPAPIQPVYSPMQVPVSAPALEPPTAPFAYQNGGSYSPTLPPTSPAPGSPNIYPYKPPPSNQHPYQPPSSPAQAPYPVPFSQPYQSPSSPQPYNNFASSSPHSYPQAQPQYISFDPTMPDLTHSKLVGAIQHHQNVVSPGPYTHPHQYQGGSQPLPLPGSLEPLPPPLATPPEHGASLTGPPIPPPRPASRQTRQSNIPPIPPPRSPSAKPASFAPAVSPQPYARPMNTTSVMNELLPSPGPLPAPGLPMIGGEETRERQADTPEEVRRVLEARDRRNSGGAMDFATAMQNQAPSPDHSPVNEHKSLPPASYFPPAPPASQEPPIAPERPVSRNSTGRRSSTTPPPAPSRFSPLVQQSTFMTREADVALETIGEDGESQAGTMNSRMMVKQWAVEEQPKVTGLHIVERSTSAQQLEDMVLQDEERKRDETQKPKAQNIFPQRLESDTSDASRSVRVPSSRSDAGLLSLETRLTRPTSPEVSRSVASSRGGKNDSSSRPLELPTDFGPMRPSSPARVGGAGALRAKSFSTAAISSYADPEPPAPPTPVKEVMTRASASPVIVKNVPNAPSLVREEYQDGRKVLNVGEQNRLKDQAVDRVANWLRSAGSPSPPPEEKQRRKSMDMAKARSSPTKELYSIAPKVVPLPVESRTRPSSAGADPRKSTPSPVSKKPAVAVPNRKPDVLSIQRSISPQPLVDGSKNNGMRKTRSASPVTLEERKEPLAVDKTVKQVLADASVPILPQTSSPTNAVPNTRVPQSTSPVETSGSSHATVASPSHPQSSYLGNPTPKESKTIDPWKTLATSQAAPAPIRGPNDPSTRHRYTSMQDLHAINSPSSTRPSPSLHALNSIAPPLSPQTPTKPVARTSIDFLPNPKLDVPGLIKPKAIRPSSPEGKLPRDIEGPYKPKYDARSARGGRGGVVTAVAGMWAQMIEEGDGTEDAMKPKSVNDFLKAAAPNKPKQGDHRLSLQAMHNMMEKGSDLPPSSRGIPTKLKRLSEPPAPANPNKASASPAYLNTAPSTGLMSNASSSTGSERSANRIPAPASNPKLQDLIKKYKAAAEGTR